MVDGLAVTGDKDAAKEQIKALYRTFTDCDCTMVEVCASSRPSTILLSKLFAQHPPPGIAM